MSDGSVNGHPALCEGPVKVGPVVMLSSTARDDLTYIMDEYSRAGLAGLKPSEILDIVLGQAARALAGRVSYAVAGGDQ